MKSVSYSFLAIIFSITGATVTEGNKKHNKSYRNTFKYKYIGTYPVNSASLITNVANWTIFNGPIPNACVALTQACAVETTIPATTTFGKRPSKKIPAVQTITGSSPRFTSLSDAAKGITAVYSKVDDDG